jgi:GNAT superfamily N-acetyltransferase
MGLDTQLIEDKTYFVIDQDGALAGCGGSSRRATLYGGDQSPGRDAALLDPAKDAARMRDMYTHPDFTRRGVGRLVLSLYEEAARAEGFTPVELMATMAGEPLYRACGYIQTEGVTDARSGVPVPLLGMQKSLCVECRSRSSRRKACRNALKCTRPDLEGSRSATSPASESNMPLPSFSRRRVAPRPLRGAHPRRWSRRPRVGSLDRRDDRPQPEFPSDIPIIIAATSIGATASRSEAADRLAIDRHRRLTTAGLLVDSRQ